MSYDSNLAHSDRVREPFHVGLEGFTTSQPLNFTPIFVFDFVVKYIYVEAEIDMRTQPGVLVFIREIDLCVVVGFGRCSEVGEKNHQFHMRMAVP